MATNVTIRNISDRSFKLRTGQLAPRLSPGDEATVDIDDARVLRAMATAENQYIVVAGSGGNGDSSGIIQVTRELNDAEIRALPTTPIQLVDPPGGTKFVVYHGGFLARPFPDWVGYDNVSAAVNGDAWLAIKNSPSSRTDSAFMLNDSDNFGYTFENFFAGVKGTENNDTWFVSLPPNLGRLADSTFFFNASALDYSLVDGGDYGLVLAVKNDSDGDFVNPGGPDDTSANVMSVTVWYSVLDVYATSNP